MPKPAIALTARDFRHAIMLAGKAVERRCTIPILEMVRCKANGSFEVTGTDLDMTIVARVGRTGKAEATFMLPDFRSVIGATSAAGGENVAMAVTDETVSITSEALQVAIKNKTPADDFPILGDIADERFATTMSHAQLRALTRVAASISTEETRYYLNGIYVHHLDGPTYRAVATDGHRLSMIDLVLPDAVGDLPGVIIPRKSLRTLLDIAGTRAAPGDEGVKLRVGSPAPRNSVNSTAPERPGMSRAEFELGSGPARVSLATKLIEGTFPDYRRVIPQAPARTMLFKSAELRRAVAAVSFGAKDVRAIRIAPDEEGALISAEYLTTGIGTSVRINCTHDWPKETVGYNGSYLLSMLDAAGGEEFVMSADDPAAPCLIRNPADTAWTGILMPMRV